MFAQGAGPAGSDVQPSREQGGEGEGAQSKHSIFFDDIKSDDSNCCLETAPKVGD